MEYKNRYITLTFTVYIFVYLFVYIIFWFTSDFYHLKKNAS